MKIDIAAPIKILLEETKYQEFIHIENNLIRTNLEITWRHILFLLSLDEIYRIPKEGQITIYKTVIIYLGSIIECLMAYKLEEMINSGAVEKSDVLKPFKKFKHLGKLYQVSEECRVCGVLETLYFKDFSDTNFFHLNQAARKSGLFDQKLFLKAEKLRKIRNKIHLSGMETQDDQYSKPEMEHFFGLAHSVMVGLMKSNV